MRVVLITPWPNVWVPMIQAEVERRGHDFQCAKNYLTVDKKPDVVIHGWAEPGYGGECVHGARNLVFCRRFEAFEPSTYKETRWDLVDDVVCVNTFIATVLKANLNRMGARVPPVHVIYNTVDFSKWSFTPRRANGWRIGMVCRIHPVKNLPLALQILIGLKGTDNYSLHIAGEIQDPSVAEYLANIARQRDLPLYFDGPVPHEKLDAWWEDKDFCLSTSISEGCPNNVIEAMAKGIKPVVHWWPGAENQFPKPLLFWDIKDAIGLIESGYIESTSEFYRSHAETFFGADNIRRVVDLALGENTDVREHLQTPGTTSPR